MALLIRHREGDSTMYAVEFQTTVKEDGSIEIPSAYRQQMKGTVRVIILADNPSDKPSIIRELLANPRHVSDFTPLSRDEIYDRSH